MRNPTTVGLIGVALLEASCSREAPTPRHGTLGPVEQVAEEVALDPDAACVNLSEQDRIFACGPRRAAEVTTQVHALSTFVESRLKGFDLCESEFGEQGQEGPYPPLSARCSAGPRHACQPTKTPAAAWEFEALPSERFPVFSKLAEASDVAFRDVILSESWWHRTIAWKKSPKGCEVDIVATADINGDGIFASKAYFLQLSEGEVEWRASPPESPAGDFVPEPDPPEIRVPSDFTPLPERGCESLKETARVRVCGPFKLQHLENLLLDFRDATLGVFVEKGLCFDEEFGPHAETSFYPPDGRPCASGPNGRCVAAAAPKYAWEYPFLSEAEYPLWNALQAYGFTPETDSQTSKRLKWDRLSDGLCEVSLEVTGDVDGDGKSGSYTVRAVVRSDGTTKTLKDPGTLVPE